MYTLDLCDIGKDDINIAGGKGANLGELIQNKIPVPQGFIVTAETYDEYIRINEIDKMIDSISERSGNDEFKSIQRKILQGNFSEEIKSHIVNSYNKMKDNKRVAVRSSATAEDLQDASFAGQQETYLNVIGIENVLQRIKDCFASCFSERSAEYRKKAGYNYGDVKCAVVVQAMIEANCAGVMFTGNVLNGNTDEILINSSYGLGESVVSGTVNPDQYTLNKNGKVLNRVLGKKEEKIIYGNKETLKVKVEPKMQSQWSLSDNDLKELCRIGNNIEKVYGHPMDIEWAEAGGQIYVLQARSITTLKESQPVMKDIEKSGKAKLSKMAKKNLAFNLEHAPYAYYPLDYEVAMILADEKCSLFREIGINTGNLFKLNDDGIVQLCQEKTHLNRNILHILRTIKEYTNIVENRKNGKEILIKCGKDLNEIEALDLEKKSLRDYGQILNNLAQIQKNIGHGRFRYYIFPAVIIGKKLNHYLKGKEKYNEYDLLSGLEYRTWKINKDLKILTDELKNYKKQMGITEENLNMDNANYLKFKEEKICSYLKKHGYKSDYNCYPFSGKSWNEDRQGFEKLLEVTMKDGDTGENNEITYDKYNRVIGVLKKNCRRNQKEILEKVDYYRECHVYREESQYMWEKCYAMMRKVLKEVSRKCSIEIEDLWFLKFSELLKMCERGHVIDEDIKKIKYRKDHRIQCENYWNSFNTLLWDENSQDGVFIGVSGSTGVQRGKACVVLSKNDFSKLKKGDILICSSTSPEWTPLFSLASAVVSDTGGALSHAAIVAREYKIPAVLGTGNATVRINDGDNLYVDGTRGRVMILDGQE